MHVDDVREERRKLLKRFKEAVQKAGVKQVEIARHGRVSVQTLRQTVQGITSNPLALDTIRVHLPAFYDRYLAPRTRAA